MGVLAAVLGVLAVGLILVFTLGGGDGEESGQRTQATGPPVVDTPAAEERQAPEPIRRGEVTVAVLNGTTIAGLAARTAERLQKSGYKLGKVADAPVQNRSATLINYADGAQRAARDVAKVVKVGSDAITRMDAGTQLQDENARVIVTVGSDQDDSQQGQTP